MLIEDRSVWESLAWIFADKADPKQLKDFRELVRQLCPTAIEDVPDKPGEVKIDVDAFDFRTFFRVDTWVRLQLPTA